MSRNFKEIEIEKKKAFVLFDTGSIRSYIREDFSSPIRWETVPFEVGLGGSFYTVKEACIVKCKIEGLKFDMETHPLKDIGADEHGRKIDAIIGGISYGEMGITS